MLISLTAPLEAVLFAAGSNGCTVEELAHILQLSVGEVPAVCHSLQEKLEKARSGLMVIEIAGTWQLATKPTYVEYLRRMATSPANTSISAAALETLAIVAYKQPIIRSDIEAIRGVQSDRVVATLVHRQLIIEVGRQEGPGRPILYGTTDHFLTTFGLRTVTDLPPLPPRPDFADMELSLFQLTPSLPRD
jgi:segregation and condensation protein B